MSVQPNEPDKAINETQWVDQNGKRWYPSIALIGKKYRQAVIDHDNQAEIDAVQDFMDEVAQQSQAAVEAYKSGLLTKLEEASYDMLELADEQGDRESIVAVPLDTVKAIIKEES